MTCQCFHDDRKGATVAERKRRQVIRYERRDVARIERSEIWERCRGGEWQFSHVSPFNAGYALTAFKNWIVRDRLRCKPTLPAHIAEEARCSLREHAAISVGWLCVSPQCNL
jgi:hypothetical protein